MDKKPEQINKIVRILNRMEPILKNGSMENFKELIRAVHATENKDLLRAYYSNTDTELISLICKYNRKKHLNYLLYESHIMHYLTCENKKREMKFKEDAFYYTMCSNNFVTLETLYDYWSGDLHWLGHKKEYNTFDVENLRQLNKLLKLAFIRYEKYIQCKRKVNPENILNIESLMAFNVFQIELYSKLNDLKESLIICEDESADIIRIQETYAIKNIILAVFDIYEKHSEQNLALNSILEVNSEIVNGYSDASTLIHRTSLFVIYEAFYRKLDYNLCMLLLDNLHLLKLRLSMPKNSYQKVENNLYYFIYHISSKWSLYLPKRNKIKAIKTFGSFKGKLCWYYINNNVNRSENLYNIIYLEKSDFEKAVKSFKNELQSRNIEDNIRKNNTKLPHEDNNALMLLPHLRDDYSLKRISQQIAQLYSINFKYEKKYAFLFIERSLQVVGEFLKSTHESLHLQPSTEALVKAEISVEIVNDLKALRNLLCHAKNGELIKRIEVEVKDSYVFDLILEELLYVKKKIDDVIKVHKPIVERDLTQKAIHVLQNRRFEMPEMVAHWHYDMIHFLSQIPIGFLRHDAERHYYEETWAPQGFSKSLMKEVSMIGVHTKKLALKSGRAIKTIHNNVILKFPFYKQRIKNSLKVILNSMEKWQWIIECFKQQNSSVDLLSYPNEKDANIIKSNNVFLDDIFVQPVEINQLFVNVENHWGFIENLLQFIVHKTRIFDNTIEELKFEMYTFKIKHLCKINYKGNDMKDNVTELLDMMEEKLNSWKICRQSTDKVRLEKIPKFTGIKEFTDKLMTPNILTHEEKSHLIKAINNTIPKNNGNGKLSDIELMINKINTNTAIPKKEYTKFIELTKLESKSQKILLNLVMGHKRNPLLPQCLKNRIFLLMEIIQQQSANQLILRYKLDKTFHVLLEVLLFDIFIVMESNKTYPLLKKSSKLLTEINLRNILTHGSPLLEVVGNVLDANDLPTELITKALEFIEDKKSIDALCDLCDLDFDFTGINNITQTSKHTPLLNKFKASCRWRDYLNLIPEFKHNMFVKQKKKLATDENCIELLKVIKLSDPELVQNCINKGANVNFIDSHNKAMVHYAAMKGSVNVLKVLLSNGADVNIINKENNLTALHYSSMNNFADSVKFLLDNGADCLALDDKGRTSVYCAGQRNHMNVCQILVRAMKKCD